jgi:hypothetical protein
MKLSSFATEPRRAIEMYRLLPVRQCDGARMLTPGPVLWEKA